MNISKNQFNQILDYAGALKYEDEWVEDIRITDNWNDEEPELEYLLVTYHNGNEKAIIWNIGYEIDINHDGKIQINDRITIELFFSETRQEIVNNYLN